MEQKNKNMKVKTKQMDEKVNSLKSEKEELNKKIEELKGKNKDLEKTIEDMNNEIQKNKGKQLEFYNLKKVFMRKKTRTPQQMIASDKKKKKCRS